MGRGRDEDSVVIKKPDTEGKQSIKQYEVQLEAWGLTFRVDSEMDAYKAAYAYRGSVATQVCYSIPLKYWYVNVYNQYALDNGIYKP